MGRSGAAAATWIFRGDESWRGDGDTRYARARRRYWAHRSYLAGTGKGTPALAREPTKGNHEIAIRTAEWHLPPDLLDATRREQMYPHAQTFCVAREPLQRLGSFVAARAATRRAVVAAGAAVRAATSPPASPSPQVGYNLGEQAQDADAMNAWLESEFDKFEAGQHPNTGHMLPQVHFARWCDVILRYETLRLDLNARPRRRLAPRRETARRRRSRKLDSPSSARGDAAAAS